MTTAPRPPDRNDELTLRDYGPAGGHPLLCLHSLALSGELFAPIGDRVGMHVLAPDLPGPVAAPGMRVVDIADALAATVARRDLGPLDVIGMSMGGCVALQFALDHPALVRRLVLADTTSSYGPNRATQWEERARSAESSTRADLLDFQLTRWFSDEFRAEHSGEAERVAEIFVRTPASVHAASARALGDFDVTGRLGELMMPTLILVGEEDYATPPAMARQLAGGIPQARLEVLPGARHFSLVESELAWQLIVEFVGE